MNLMANLIAKGMIITDYKGKRKVFVTGQVKNCLILSVNSQETYKFLCVL